MDRREAEGITVLSKIFVSQWWKNTLGNTSVYRKKFMHNMGLLRFSIEIFSSRSAVKNRMRAFIWFEKIHVSKNFSHSREGEHRGFFSIFFVSLSTDRIRRGSVLYFRKYRVWRNLCIRRGFHHSPLNFFFTLTINLVGEHICISKKLLVSKFVMRRRAGGVVTSRFCRINFVSQDRKTS